MTVKHFAKYGLFAPEKFILRQTPERGSIF